MTPEFTKDGVHPDIEDSTAELSTDLFVEDPSRLANPVYDLAERINAERERFERAGVIKPPRISMMKRIVSGSRIGSTVLTGPPVGQILAAYTEEDEEEEQERQPEASSPKRLNFAQLVPALLAMRADLLEDGSLGDRKWDEVADYLTAKLPQFIQSGQLSGGEFGVFSRVLRGEEAVQEMIQAQVDFNKARPRFEEAPKKRSVNKLIGTDFEGFFDKIINFPLDLLAQEAYKTEAADWRQATWTHRLVTPGRLRTKIDKHYQWEGHENGYRDVFLEKLEKTFMQDLELEVAANGISVGWANLKKLSPTLKIHLEREESNICARIHKHILTTPGYQIGLEEETKNEEGTTKQHLTRLLNRRLVRLFGGRVIVIAENPEALKRSLAELPSMPKVFSI
jgi:hypothetical protein